MVPDEHKDKGASDNKLPCVLKLRPDGLGNRLEQVMNLAAHKGGCTLLWPGESSGRGNTYAGLSKWIKVDGCSLVENENITQTLEEGLKCPVMPGPIRGRDDLKRMATNCQRIHPNFDIGFNNSESPVGVHIRKSDRLAKFKRLEGAVNDFTTPEESELALELTIGALLEKNPNQGVFIASDDSKAAIAMGTKLQRGGVRIVKPVMAQDEVAVPSFIVDFFGLSLCTEIWMVSSFSSFAIMAARVGEDVPLYSMLPPTATHLQRYELPYVLPYPQSNIRLTNVSLPPIYHWETAENSLQQAGGNVNKSRKGTVELFIPPIMSSIFFSTASFLLIVLVIFHHRVHQLQR
jgi:hypothetical protein